MGQAHAHRQRAVTTEVESVHAADGSATRITVLGPSRLHGDAGTVDLGAGRQSAVLIRLVVAGGHVVSTDRLIEDLWHGEPPPKALAALQVHVSNLRRVLEPRRPPRAPARVLVSRQPGYALGLPVTAVDAWEFATLAARPEPADAAERYRRASAALDLWQGEPFGAFTAKPWAQAEVTRLSALRLTLVERAADAALALGRADEVTHRLAPECDRHPDREELFRLLALAHYRLGRQAEALATLRTVRSYLADELGIDPGPALRRLEADILAHSPALDAHTPTATTSTAPAPETAPVPEALAVTPVGGTVGHTTPPRAFAGREDETERLLRIAEAVPETGLRLVWLTAEAGGGKSSFAETVAARLSTRGWTTAVARCPEVDGAPPAWAWRELLGAVRVSPAEPDGDDPFGLARAVVHACRARPGGVLLVVDDAHRADSATLQVLRQTIAWMRELPVLVVATYRPSEAGDELRATSAALVTVTADRLELAGLSDEGIAEVARSVGLTRWNDDILTVLRTRTDGNPLFVRELAQWIASHGPHDALSSVPSGVREVLLRRIDRLPAEVGRMLRLTAVCGRGTGFDTLLALWTDPGAPGPPTEDDLLDAVDTAVVAGLLRADIDRVDFRHVLVRDAIYSSIPPLRLRRMHWRVLCHLRTLDSPDPDELAHHAARGASAAHALALVESAARARFDAGFRSDSAPLWREAVALREGLGHGEPDASPGEREALIEALCELVTALAHRGEIADARAHRGRALVLAGDDERRIARVLTCWRSPRIWTTRTQGVADPQMIAALRTALASARDDDRAALLVAAAFEFEGNDDAFASACASEAVELARTRSDPELRCAALNASALFALGPDLHDRLPAVTAEFLAAARESGHVAYRAAAHYYRFLAHLSRTDLPAAAAEVRTALETATSGRVGELVVVLSAFDAVLDVLRGDLDAAATAYEELAARLGAAGVANGAELGLIGAIVVAYFRGSLAHLTDRVETMYRYAPDTMAWVYVVALLDAGRDAEAAAIAHRDPPVPRDYYWTARSVFRARAVIRLRRHDRAAVLYAELRHRTGTVAGLDSASVALGPMDDVLAELADLLGEHEAAAEHRARAERVRAAVRAGLERIDAAAALSPR